jgi:hypothetical protein
MESISTRDKDKPKRKRDWKSGNLPRVFTVRANDEEYEELKRMADETGWSLSRLVIEGTIGKTIKTSEQAGAERQDIEAMIFQMRRIGINLNQISTALSAVKRGKKVSVTEQKLEAAIEEVESLIEQLRTGL